MLRDGKQGSPRGGEEDQSVEERPQEKAIRTGLQKRWESLVWWLMPVILALRRLRQEDGEFQVTPVTQ